MELWAPDTRRGRCEMVPVMRAGTGDERPRGLGRARPEELKWDPALLGVRRANELLRPSDGLEYGSGLGF